MPYDRCASSASPRLLILLTDQLEESVKIVNKLIDEAIKINYDGDAPKNRLFISVIGFNNGVKDLCSGWLKELDELPLRLEKRKKKVMDGAGGFVDVDVMYPFWIDHLDSKPASGNDTQAIHLVKDMLESWKNKNYTSPASIVIDCSHEFHGAKSVNEIEQLKQIATIDGQTLFFGTYSKEPEKFTTCFSQMPKDWNYKFERRCLDKNLYCGGLLDRHHISEIICSIMETGGMAALDSFEL